MLTFDIQSKDKILMAEEKETDHIITVSRRWALKNLAAKKPHFKVVNGEVVSYKINPPANDLETTIAAAVAGEKREREEAQKRAEAELIANAQIGEMIEGHGIFF